MPTRMLREGILTSEPVSLLSWPAEVFYRRLMSAVDDFGRYYAKPELLRAICYPLQLDKVGNPDIAKWLGETQKTGLVRVYAVSGKEFLEIVNFRQQVRAKHGSKYPAPPADVTQMPSNCVANDAVVVDVFVDEDVGVRPAPQKRAKRKDKTPLADDFAISDRVKAWAAEKGFDRLDQHLESFVSKCRAKGYAYVDWDEAFMNAVRENWAKLQAKASVRAVDTTCCEDVAGQRCGMPGSLRGGGNYRCDHHQRQREERSNAPMPAHIRQEFSKLKRRSA